MPGLTFNNDLPTSLRIFVLLNESAIVVTVCARLTRHLLQECVRFRCTAYFVDVDGINFSLRVDENIVTVKIFSRRLYQAYGLCYRRFRFDQELLYEEWRGQERAGLPSTVPYQVIIRPQI